MSEKRKTKRRFKKSLKKNKINVKSARASMKRWIRPDQKSKSGINWL